MYLTQLAHFDDEGWAIFADVEDIDEDKCDLGKANQNMIFYSMEFFNDKPRKFKVYSPTFDHRLNQGNIPTCDVRYTEVDSDKALIKGLNIFFFVGARQSEAPKEMTGRVSYGKITEVDYRKERVKINDQFFIDMFTVMAHNHNYEQIKGTNAKICKYCENMLFTPKYAENKKL